MYSKFSFEWDLNKRSWKKRTLVFSLSQILFKLCQSNSFFFCVFKDTTVFNLEEKMLKKAQLYLIFRLIHAIFHYVMFWTKD